jgi:hypothetical protein
MKKLVNILFILIFGMNATACNTSQSNENIISNDSLEEVKKIEVYYFHYTRRCATCRTVENVTKSILEELYPEDIKTGEITFITVNLEEKNNKSLAEKYQVSGQTLLFVSGSETVNLTNKGFMYARSNPDKLKEEIKKTVYDLLNQ